MRAVPALAFLAGDTPTFLRTSGRPNRCNPRGVDCLYFCETEATASLEWSALARGTPLENAPKLTYVARVALRRIIDLGNRRTRRRLRLGETELFGAWRAAAGPTRLQRLGLALGRQSAIAALRYPSAAARRAGKSGWNVAIFPAAVAHPDRVEILGPSGDRLEALPRGAEGVG